MKTKFYLSLLLIALTGSLVAQNIELTPYTSYHFGGKINYYGGDAKFNDGQNYGIGLNIKTSFGASVQLEYMRQSTSFKYRHIEYTDYNYITHPVDMDWYQIAFLKYVEYGKLEPYGGISLGALNFLPRTNEVDETWKFAMTAQVGIKYFINDKIGIRLHARMLMPIQWGGFGIYAGSGGVSTGVSAGSYIVQGDLGGGLVFRLGKNGGTAGPTSTPPAQY